jgi:hypothetical protein
VENFTSLTFTTPSEISSSEFLTDPTGMSLRAVFIRLVNPSIEKGLLGRNLQLRVKQMLTFKACSGFFSSSLLWEFADSFIKIKIKRFKFN